MVAWAISREYLLYLLMAQEKVNQKVLEHQGSIDRSLKEMVRLMRWDMKRRGGIDPPPGGEG